MTRTVTAVAVLVAALAVAACGSGGGGSGGDRFDLALDFYVNPDHAGIVILTLMAVGLFALTAVAERIACPWNRKDALA